MAESFTKTVGVQELLDAGLHFGHQTKRWNPKMKRYIHGAKNGIYIIDLNKTLSQLELSKTFLKEVILRGEKVLFVGTKKQAREIFKETAVEVNQPYVIHRWLGGMLTNSQTIRSSVARMRELQRMEKDGTMEKLPKKEVAMLRRELSKLDRNLCGIAEMEKKPGALFVVDLKRERLALAEAERLNIPVVALVDTNADPDLVEYPIPGNDDSLRSIGLICSVLGETIKEADVIYTAKAKAEREEREKAEAEEREKAKIAREERKKKELEDKKKREEVLKKIKEQKKKADEKKQAEAQAAKEEAKVEETASAEEPAATVEEAAPVAEEKPAAKAPAAKKAAAPEEAEETAAAPAAAEESAAPAPAPKKAAAPAVEKVPAAKEPAAAKEPVAEKAAAPAVAEESVAAPAAAEEVAAPAPAPKKAAAPAAEKEPAAKEAAAKKAAAPKAEEVKEAAPAAETATETPSKKASDTKTEEA